jgi:alkanesulfonate monooxygenase SsuD/methylene tetrahydromethanopterin reductase-like flavin-dependent oxidoreductase (luciferase family)
VYIDEDESRIRQEVGQYLQKFLAFNCSPLESIRSEEKKAELRAKGYGFYASDALDSLAKLSYEQIVEQEIAFVGTPERVIQQVRAVQVRGGIGELAIVANFGGIEHWKSIKTQHLFARHVIPAFRKQQHSFAGETAAD